MPTPSSRPSDGPGRGSGVIPTIRGVALLAAAFWALSASPAAAAAAAYRIGRGDVLKVEVAMEPSLTGTFVVSEEGTILYPLLGALPVAGRTVPEIAGLIRKRLAADFLQSPQVAVFVAEYNSQKVVILGDVPRPGFYTLKQDASLMSLLAEAGLRIGSEEGTVILTRAAALADGGTSIPVVVSLAQLPEAQGATSDLEPATGDQILVRLLDRKRVIITGKVKRPGVIPHDPALTLMEAISRAGGVAEFGTLRGVRVVRGAPDRPRVIEVDLTGVVTGDTSKDMAIEPGDVVIVPRSLF